MANRLKTLLREGKPAVGAWVGFSDPYSVEAMADAGFDWLLIDTEHFPIGRESLRTILMAMKGSVSAPVVRLGSNSLDHFQTALDLGASGVMVPMVNSDADAEQAVQFCRYPPRGMRGFAPTRASHYFQNLEAYVSQADENITLLVQIETPEAASNIEQIMGVDGIDGIFLGPSDLASFLNRPMQISHPDVVAVLDKLMERARAHSMPWGLPTWSPEEYLSYARRGGQLLTIGSDLSFMLNASRKTLDCARKIGLKPSAG